MMHIVHRGEHTIAKKEQRMCQYCKLWPPTQSELEFQNTVEGALNERREKRWKKQGVREAPYHIVEHKKASEEERECRFCNLIPMPPSIYQFDVVGNNLSKYYDEYWQIRKKKKTIMLWFFDMISWIHITIFGPRRYL